MLRKALMLYRMFSIYCTYTFYQFREISQSFSENMCPRKLIGVSEMSQIRSLRNRVSAPLISVNIAFSL